MDRDVPFPDPFDPELKVLVLAGSNELPERRLRQLEQQIADGRREVPLQNKAFLPVRGRLVIEYLLDSLQALGLRHIWVLGQQEQLERIPDRYDVELLAQRPGATMGTNLGAAYASIIPDDDEHVLIVFGDHPLTSPVAIADFLRGCAARLDVADFFHGVATTRSYRAFSMVSRRTSVFLREFSGRATGLNLAVPSRIHRFRVFDHMYSVRKQEQFGRFASLILRAVYLLGPKAPLAIVDAIRLHGAKECQKLKWRGGWSRRLGELGTRFFRWQVPARRMEAYVARVLELERGFRFVPLDHGGTAVDVDFFEELAALENHWDSLQEIVARQDAAGGGTEGPDAEATTAQEGEETSSSSRYAVR